MAVRYPMHAYKTGDWARAKVAFARLAMTSPAMAAVIRQEAHALKGRIHQGMWSGQFDKQYRWPPLGPMTMERRLNPHNPKLIDSSGFVSAIRVLHMGWNVYGVGIPKNARDHRGESYAQIAMVHERGLAINNWGFTIPARPFWGDQYAKSRKTLLAKLLAAKRATVLRGWRRPGARFGVGQMQLPPVLKMIAVAHGAAFGIEAITRGLP
jgi:hypothetical protein